MLGAFCAEIDFPCGYRATARTVQGHLLEGLKRLPLEVPVKVLIFSITQYAGIPPSKQVLHRSDGPNQGRGPKVDIVEVCG